MKKNISLSLSLAFILGASLGCSTVQIYPTTPPQEPNDPYEDIYNALNIKEKASEEINNMMFVVKHKSVGGLTCSHSIDINSGVEAYGCNLTFSFNHNVQDLYKSLTVKERAVSSVGPNIKFVKSVGTLDCIHTLHANGYNSYACNLD